MAEKKKVITKTVNRTGKNLIKKALVVKNKKAASNIDADKYLIHLDVDRDVIEKRTIEKGRSTDSLSHWDERWEDPDEEEGFKLLKYPNNTQEDMEAIKSEMERIFRS